MSIKGRIAVAVILLSAIFMSGCNKSSNEASSNSNQPANMNSGTTTKTTSTPTEPNADGTIPSGTGTEKEKPAPGKGNVQGKVFYNGQPVEGIEVKLCESFNQFMNGCGGESYVAKTDKDGEYLIKDVTPKVYEALTAKVFNTNYYVFATSGIISAAKYKIEDGKTFFAPDTNLFKMDLKLQNPKAGAKISGSGIEVKWDAYPDASYYKFTIQADSSSGAETNYDYINKRVEGTSYTLDKPLAPGEYSCKVEAYNSNDIKLSESADDIKFTVTGGAAK
ncbi:MAG TPA: carboxypeptidase-like regulatory domain-containing protein [Pyrinomonadaceae bacterium]